MDGTAPQATRRTGLWCRVCGEPARLSGGGLWPEYRKAVHAATGLEEGPGPGGGAHAARPTDEDPALRAQADKVEAMFGGRYKISVRFGIWRCDPPGPGTPYPVHARSAAEMTARLRALAALGAPGAGA